MGMGNREALLEGAKTCLIEKGFDKTTVRDIVAAAGGVSMAAIGYHFGSREALLMEALLMTMEEWGEAAGATIGGEPFSADGYARVWDRLMRSAGEQHGLWRASLEAFLQSDRSPEFAKKLSDGHEEGRRGVTAWLTSTPEAAVAEADVRGLGSVQLALMSGLMMQRLLDPVRSPTGSDVVRGLRELADKLERDL